MKRLVATFGDDVGLEFLAPILSQFRDFKIETVEEPVKKISRPTHRFPGKTMPKVILSHFIPQGMFTMDLAVEWCRKEGYSNPSSVNPALSSLIELGCIERIGVKKYRFLNRKDQA